VIVSEDFVSVVPGSLHLVRLVQP